MKYFLTLKFRILASYALVGVSGCLLTALLLGTGSVLRREVLLAALIFSAFLAFISAWLVIRLLSGSLVEITGVARRFAAGDLSSRIPVRSSGEIGELSATLNAMADELGRRVRDAELRRLELEAAFSNMAEAVVVTDGAGVIARMNPRARALLLAPGGASGARLMDMPGGPELSAAALKALASGLPVSSETLCGSVPGIVLSVTASPIREQGIIGGCVVVARDITAERRLEAMRRDFVANVSHELRTPLTAIKGYVETLLDGALEDKEHAREFLGVIGEHAKRLDNIVADLLKLSRLESGASLLEKSEIELKTLADGILAGFPARFLSGPVKVSNLLAPGLTARADRARLEQVFINLLDNAVKFTPQGGSVEISAQDLRDSVKVLVRDNGSGIPAEHLPRLFERFYRVDKARSRELGGTGLGLSIVRHIVELHGGSVGVESAEGKGSTFWFTVPK